MLDRFHIIEISEFTSWRFGERAREMKAEGSRGNNHCNIWSSTCSANDQRTIQKRSNSSAASERRIKKLKQEILHRLMTNLPIDVLYEIAKRLSLPDFLSVGRVCNEWRLFFTATRKIYLACMPPLAVSMKYHGKKTMHFCNMTNGERYNTKVMYYVKKLFKGISYGFITMEDLQCIWFANPITSEQLEFLKPSGTTFDFTDRAILMKLIPSGEYLTVVLHKDSQSIWASRLGSGSWVTYSYLREPWHIIDLAVTNDRVLGLTSNGWVGILLLSASLKFKIYKLETKHFSEGSKLVVSVTEHPMVVEPLDDGGFQIFQIDFALREWVLVDNFGDQALFADDRKTYTFCDPRGWGGLTNCIYRLNSNQDTCSVYSVASGSKIQEMSIQRIPFSYTRSWYFPNMSCRVAHVLDDDQPPQPNHGCDQQP